MVATPVLKAAIQLTKEKSHGNNVCDVIIAYMISADTQTNRRRKCKHYMWGEGKLKQTFYWLASHSSSLSQAATDIWTIDSGISYTGSIGWRITDSRILSNAESTLLWMDDKASSPCL